MSRFFPVGPRDGFGSKIGGPATASPGGDGHLPKRPCLIGVIPGEGIGPEVIDAALRVLRAASQRFGL